MYQLLGSGAGNMSWLCSNGWSGAASSGADRQPSANNNKNDGGDSGNGNVVNRSRTSRWRRKTRESAARSKTGLWGPTHSFSSNEEGEADGGDGDDDDSEEPLRKNDLATPPLRKVAVGNNSQGTDSTKSSSQDSSPENKLLNSSNDNKNNIGNGKGTCLGGFNTHEPVETMQHALGRVWNNLQCLEDTTLRETLAKRRTIQRTGGEEKKEELNLSGRGEQQHDADQEQPPAVTLNESTIMDFLDEVCSPCRPKNLNHSHCYGSSDETPLGIQRLAPPNLCAGPVNCNGKKQTSDFAISGRDIMAGAASNSRAASGATATGNGSSRHQRNGSKTNEDATSVSTTGTAADRRRQRHASRQQTTPSGPAAAADDSSSTLEAYEVTNGKKVLLVRKEPKVNIDIDTNRNQAVSTVPMELPPRPLPMDRLELNKQKAVELERSISELTMRSSYGEATAKIAENRRMAYYAVGRHHRQSGRGGNRRCYFTGKLILGGAPFYAGSVQQGLRTLVVFCLPSALGLPKEMQRGNSPSVRTSMSNGRPSLASTRENGSIANSLGYGANKSTSSLISRKGSRLSRLSSVDDTSMSCEEELDPNWELDRDYLLRVLPEPSQPLLDEMALRYPAQFETLPVQVRSPHCWKLYVKFCFFSGLPIAEGEMHYKVIDAIADQYGEEVILSNEVMEAVNGDSAEILRLPNLKTFRYLRRHYQQQSAKLPDDCFQRQGWEMVRPEV